MVFPCVELCLVGKGGKVGLVGELVVIKIDASRPDPVQVYLEVIITFHPIIEKLWRRLIFKD
jgi:hypothetical protein